MVQQILQHDRLHSTDFYRISAGMSAIHLGFPILFCRWYRYTICTESGSLSLRIPKTIFASVTTKIRWEFHCLSSHHSRYFRMYIFIYIYIFQEYSTCFRTRHFRATGITSGNLLLRLVINAWPLTHASAIYQKLYAISYAAVCCRVHRPRGDDDRVRQR